MGNLGKEVKTGSRALREKNPPFKIDPKNPRSWWSRAQGVQEAVFLIHRRQGCGWERDCDLVMVFLDDDQSLGHLRLSLGSRPGASSGDVTG